MVEVLNFMGYFVKYWNKNDFTVLTALYLNLFHFFYNLTFYYIFIKIIFTAHGHVYKL